MSVLVADVLSDGTVATVDCGSGATTVDVGTGDSETCTYVAYPPGRTADSNTATGTFNIGGFRIETDIEFGARISATSYPDLFTSNGQALADGDVNVDLRAWERSCTGTNLDGGWAVFDMNFWMHHDPRADFDSTLSSASGNVRMLSGGENRVLLRITAGGWFPFSETVSEDEDTFGYQRLFMQ